MLVADAPTVVQSIRVALRHTAGFLVVATVDGRSSAREQLSELRPDVVLVDEMCQRTNAMSRLRESREAAPGATVVLLSSSLEAAAVEAAIDAGADAVISRGLHAATLGTLLREIADGNVIHAPRPAGRRAHLRPLADQPPAARTSA
jgi:two-component system, NarL family, response regulator LiaR